MTQRDERQEPGANPSDGGAPDDARTARLRREIESGQEARLSEEDYQYALEQGLIEG